jgi:hypothetical protein
VARKALLTDGKDDFEESCLDCQRWVQLVAPISLVIGRDWAPPDDVPPTRAGVSNRDQTEHAAGRSTARVLHARGAGRRSVQRHRASRSRELGPRMRLRALRAQKEIMAPGWRPIILAPVREA